MPTQNKTFSWQAPEFRYYEKNSAWYVTLMAVCVLIIGFFAIEGDWFAAITIFILAGCVVFFSTQRPEIVEVELNSKSLHFANIAFPYKQLKHFWIVNNQNHKTLNFETSTVLNNTIVVELMDQDEDEIRNFLLQFIPEHHETTETFAQKISHRLKF